MLSIYTKTVSWLKFSLLIRDLKNKPEIIKFCHQLSINSFQIEHLKRTLQVHCFTASLYERKRFDEGRELITRKMVAVMMRIQV